MCEEKAVGSIKYVQNHSIILPGRLIMLNNGIMSRMEQINYLYRDYTNYMKFLIIQFELFVLELLMISHAAITVYFLMIYFVLLHVSYDLR